MKTSFAKGRFEVVRPLGSGGMGEVFEVLDREQGVRLALKQLRDFSAEALLQLKAEFRAVRDLHHPNLVALGELIIEEGRGFFTMELVEGTDFLGYVRPAETLEQRERSPATQVVADETAELSGVAPTLELDRRALALKGVGNLRGAAMGTRGSSAPGSCRVAAPPGLDEIRLRRSLQQLAEALLALHDAGKVHRDVKPPNIRVTPEGRVVLLDFGLVTPDGKAGREAQDGPIIGTPLYMSPEQIESAPVGPASDWYAVGMLLYHALLGGPPLSGSVKDMFLYKLHFELEPPEAVLLGIPHDLNALCVDLLKRHPADRPRGREIRERLGGPGATASPAAAAAARTTPFVGREVELALLQGALAELGAGKGVTVVLQGESGLGKTALARTFLEGVTEQDPSALVLMGRCHERESLPYKALDGVVDGVVEALGKLPEADQERFAPPDVALLTRAFPVLGRLAPFASPASPAQLQLAPAEQRRRVFTALRELLVALSLARPLLLFFDDMQWADADSYAALRAIFLPPARPRILALVTARGRGSQLWAPPPPFDLTALGQHVRHIRVEPLSAARTLELVQRLLPAGATSAAALALESGGHPLFVQELVLHQHQTAAEPQVGGDSLQLDEALWARVGRLPLAPRTLLGMVAVAGSPLSNEILAEATSLSSEEYAQAVETLRQGRLVRALGLKRQDTLEHFHDRIRESVLAHLPAPQRRETHERIARAVERLAPGDAETLAIHWQGAGNAAAASGHAEVAATQADEAFAFERAVRLWRLALTLEGDAATERKRPLTTRLADALARAGHNAEAGGCYLDASAQAPGPDAIKLKALAAERYLLAGYLKEGMPHLRSALTALHLPWRRASYATLVSLIGLRLRMKLRGLRYRLREEAEIPPELLLQLDALRACCAPLTFVDLLAASYYNMRYVLAALEAGEPGRLARAFALEYGLSSALNPRNPRRSELLLNQAKALARDGGDKPESRAFILLHQTVNAYTHEGDMEAALRFSTEAERLLRETGGGAAWELSALGQFANLARYNRGEWAQMRLSVLQNLGEAEDRGDAFGVAFASTAGLNCTWLMVDDPAEARRRIDVATERYPRDRTYTVHFYELFARVNLDLYLGDARAAHRRVLEAWGPVASTFLLRVPMAAYLMWGLLGRSSLALAVQSAPSERKALLQTATRAARKVAKTRFDWGSAGAEILLAGVATVEGKPEEAVSLLAAAEPRFARCGVGLHLWVAQLGRGRLLGGEEGKALKETATTRLVEQGVRDPERMARVFNPLV